MQPKCNSRFYLKRNCMAVRTLRKKTTTKSCLFRHYFLCLHSRVIENKRDEFCRKKNMKIQSGGETVRNVSVQQGENEGQ